MIMMGIMKWFMSKFMEMIMDLCAHRNIIFHHDCHLNIYGVNYVESPDLNCAEP